MREGKRKRKCTAIGRGPSPCRLKTLRTREPGRRGKLNFQKGRLRLRRNAQCVRREGKVPDCPEPISQFLVVSEGWAKHPVRAGDKVSEPRFPQKGKENPIESTIAPADPGRKTFPPDGEDINRKAHSRGQGRIF